MCRALPCEEAPEPDPACDELHVAADGELRRKAEHCFDADNHPLYVRDPCELRHPDRRGYAHLSFHAAPEDVVEEVRPRLADEDDGPLYIPQFTGCWWGLRDVLRKAGFEDVTEEGLTFARKTFQAAAVTENGGQPWLQAFIQALAETPLLVTFEPSMKLFKNLLDLPYVLQQQQQP